MLLCYQVASLLELPVTYITTLMKKDENQNTGFLQYDMTDLPPKKMDHA